MSAASSLTPFSKVDASRIDISELDESKDDSIGGMGMGMEDDEMMGVAADMERELLAVSMGEEEVGITVDVAPKTHGEGVVQKTLLAAGEALDNPRDGCGVWVSYHARVVGGGTAFDTCDEQMIEVGAGVLPPGVEAGVKTMREGERAVFTVQPAKAFGAAGDASKGVPPDSAVEYTMTCHRIIETTRFDEGRIVKRRLKRGEKWERPSENDEVTVRWKGWLEDDAATVFHEEGVLEWTAGAANVPPVFNQVCESCAE
jgi:FK506-binding protein 4/5